MAFHKNFPPFTPSPLGPTDLDHREEDSFDRTDSGVQKVCMEGSDKPTQTPTPDASPRKTFSVARSAPPQLRLYTEQTPKTPRPGLESIGSLPEMLRAFEKLTGWSLSYENGAPGNLSSTGGYAFPLTGAPALGGGQLFLKPREFDSFSSVEGGRINSLDVETVKKVASALAEVVNELLGTRQKLWQREAELAAGVPLTPLEDEQRHLAERLQATLKGGVEATNCQAAALYLLDEATTSLKMRACWGLPFERLTAPARPLQGSVSDLEALLGHAVVLENTSLMPGWNVPEDFPAAVCVPISSPTTLLGTLWFFCNETRMFGDDQVNVVELVAGKIAGDLEREMLMQEGMDGAKLKKQWDAAERLQRHQLPTVSPLFDGWKMSGWASQSQGIGGAFYDWFCLPEGFVALSVGEAMNKGLEAAFTANTVKTAFRSHGQHYREAPDVMRQTNMTLWTSSAGDQFASAWFGYLEIATGRISFAQAGKPSIIVLRTDGWESLSGRVPMLGESPESEFEPFGYELQPEEALLVCTEGFRKATDRKGVSFGETGLAQLLTSNLHLSADQLTSMARESLRLHAEDPHLFDLSVIVIKRTS